jgi:5-methylcytosine-specific restriction endonuclease McrA
MQRHRVDVLAPSRLRRGMFMYLKRDRQSVAMFLVYLGEFDAQQLYLPEAYPSMYAYCRGELGLAHDAATRRIHAARYARRHPVLIDAIADGRIELSAIGLLGPHLNEGNAEALVALAAGKSCVEIRQTLDRELGLNRVDGAADEADELGSNRVPQGAKRHELRGLLSPEVQELLDRAHDGLSHTVGFEDSQEVLKRALTLLVEQIERERFAATDAPRERTSDGDGRYIPADIQRAVRTRDDGQCTFVGDNGRRCDSRALIEFDHRVPLAKGGQTTVENLRLLCRPHNRFEAKRAFGAGFIESKRSQAAVERAEYAAKVARAQELVPWVRSLGVPKAEALDLCIRYGDIPDATLEERLKAVLKHLGPRGAKYEPAPSPRPTRDPS